MSDCLLNLCFPFIITSLKGQLVIRIFPELSEFEPYRMSKPNTTYLKNVLDWEYYAIILKSVADRNTTNSVTFFFNLCIILKEYLPSFSPLFYWLHNKKWQLTVQYGVPCFLNSGEMSPLIAIKLCSTWPSCLFPPCEVSIRLDILKWFHQKYQ